MALTGVSLMGIMVFTIINGNFYFGLIIDVIIGVPAVICILWLSRRMESAWSVRINSNRILSCIEKNNSLESVVNDVTDPVFKEFLHRLVESNRLYIKQMELSRDEAEEEGRFRPDKDFLDRLNKSRIELSEKMQEMICYGTEKDAELKLLYQDICSSFSRMCDSERISYVLSESQGRGKRVCDTVECRIGYDTLYGIYVSAPCLKNRNEDRLLYIFPQFIVLINSKNQIDTFDRKSILNSDGSSSFRIMPHSAISLKCERFRYHCVENRIPKDSKFIGYTYKHLNKDGSKDHRFADNPSVPIVEMAELQVPEFNISYWISRSDDAKEFCSLFERLQNRKPSGTSEKTAPTPSEKIKTEKKVVTPEENHRSAEEQLHALVGMGSVKQEFKTIQNFARVQAIRASNGLKSNPVSYHCVFTGNPGTGKTTAARILADIFREAGVIRKGHLVETDRSGLVAEYVGQTAVKTNAIIDSALDGILFIDEAYTLVNGSRNDFGMEAIATLLKRMEDDRDRLVVVLAGYTDEMQTFIDSNPGLQSRFTRHIQFPDYQEDELYEIFLKMLKYQGYHIDMLGEAAVKLLIHQKYIHKDKYFGNARFVRNMLESIIMNQANRLSGKVKMTQQDLQTITDADVLSLFSKN